MVEAFLEPGCGPMMHTHLKQDESLTVEVGKMMYQILGEEPVALKKGETVLFKRGTPHKFWNAVEDILKCSGWISPVHSVVYFLASLYNAQNKSGKAQPETFDGVYLIRRYSDEYDLPEIPAFVKRIIIPTTYFFGVLLGKYKHFNDSPKPL